MNSEPEKINNPGLYNNQGKPIALGKATKTTIERADAYSRSDLIDIRITVLEALRGAAAWERLKAQNIINHEPPKGFEYVLAHIRLGYFPKGKRTGVGNYTLAEGQFCLKSEGSETKYEFLPVLKWPSPELIGYTFSPGETREGWILFQVPEKDKNVLLIFQRKHAEAKYGLWWDIKFKLS